MTSVLMRRAVIESKRLTLNIDGHGSSLVSKCESEFEPSHGLRLLQAYKKRAIIISIKLMVIYISLKY